MASSPFSFPRHVASRMLIVPVGFYTAGSDISDFFLFMTCRLVPLGMTRSTELARVVNELRTRGTGSRRRDTTGFDVPELGLLRPRCEVGRDDKVPAIREDWSAMCRESIIVA